jgi:hypothetical protein
MLREVWGSEWNDELLNVPVLQVDAPPDWMEKREQALHQWHRLKAEVGKPRALSSIRRFRPMKGC